MILEAARLQQWYESPQGQIVAQLIGHIITQWLCTDRKETMALGLGFPQPYLDQITSTAHNNLCVTQILGASPAEMGVLPWPSAIKNRFSQARPDALPFPDQQFEQVIMAHFLEGCDSPEKVLRETWRVLTPGGRLLTLVPNRGGLWARHDATPFGWGRPFSPRQLSDLLNAALFVPCQSRFALFMPPFSGTRFLRTASTWEKAGDRWFAPLGGAILYEAEKVAYATTSISSQNKSLHAPQLHFSRGFASGFHNNPIKKNTNKTNPDTH